MSVRINGGRGVRSLRSIAARFGWGVADQSLSSLTNLALGLIAARTLNPSEFGAFTLVFAVYLVALGAVRAITSEPLVIRYTGVSREDWQRGVKSATGTAVVVGVAAGIMSAVAALIAPASLRGGLLALAVSMPGLLLQDTWRFAFFSQRRGSAAFHNDLAWAVALAAGIALLLVLDTQTVGALVLVWGGAGTLAGLFGLLQASVAPLPKKGVRWLREQRDLIPRFLAEFGVTIAVGQFTVFGLAALAGIDEAGALRAGQLILGPLNVLFLGMSVVAVPEGVRSLRISHERLLRMCRRISQFLGICAVVLGTLLWILPTHLGVALLQDNWAGAHRVVLPLSLGMVGFGGVLGAGVGLRALAAARLSLRARLMAAPIALAGGLGGAALAGSVGAAWGLALGSAWAAGVWWWHFVLGLRQYERAETLVNHGGHDDDDRVVPNGEEARGLMKC